MGSFDRVVAQEKKTEVQQKVADSKPNTSGSSQPAVNPDSHGNNWERHFADMPDNRQQAVAFGNDRLDAMFMNALNGQYKYVVGREKKTGTEGDKNSPVNAIVGLGQKAWEIASLAKNYKTKDEYNKLNKLRIDFQKQANDAESLIQLNTDTLGLTLDDNFKLTTAEKVAKLSQQVKVKKEMTSNQRFEEEGWSAMNVFKGLTVPITYMPPTPKGIVVIKDKFSGWKEVVSDQQLMRDGLKNANGAVIESWLNYGFSNWNNDKFGSETGKLDNKTNMLNLSITALGHISKFGLEGEGKSNPEASKLLSEIMSPKGDDKAKTQDQLIYDRSSEIKDLVGKMGYYGKKLLGDKYKTVFNSSYYEGKVGSLESQDKMKAMLNEISTASEHLDKTDEVNNSLKLKAINEALLIIRSNKKGYVPESRNTPAGGSTLMVSNYDSPNYSPKTDTPTENIDDFVSKYIFDLGQDGKLKSPMVSSFEDVRKKLKSLGSNTSNGYWAVPVPKGIGNKQDQFGNQHLSYTALKDAYDRVSSKYHEKVNETSFDQIFKDSLAVVGFGLKGSYHLEHDNIDPNNDSGKNKNFNVIRNLIKSEMANNNVYVAHGGIDNAAIESNLDKVSASTREKMFEALSNNDNRYKVTFSRESPIKDKSAYVVTTLGKKPQSTTFYVDTKRAEATGEEYALATMGSPQERSYQRSGKWDLKAWNDNYDYFQNPEIRTIKGAKYLRVSMWDIEQGKHVQDDVFLGPDGSTTIDNAERIAKTILDEQEEDYRTYYKK